MEKNPIEIEKETAFELMFGKTGKVTILVSEMMELTENIEKKIDINEKALITLGKLILLIKEIESCFVGRQNAIIFQQTNKTKQQIQLFLIQLLCLENKECKINISQDQASITIFGDKIYRLTQGLNSIKMYKNLVYSVPLGRYTGLRQEAAEKLISEYVKEITPRINTVRRFIYEYKTGLQKAYNEVLEAHETEVTQRHPQREFASN